MRDLLAGRPIADLDLATPDPPDAVAAALAAAGIRTIPTGVDHGTLTALAAGQSFEITTLRRDHDTDGRHARVEFTDDWQEDAARRDFTINAMSMTRDGMLHDYFTGRADLAAGLVRFVGDAAARVTEDYLRILRFFRFHARYGTGAPDPAAIAAIRAGIPGLPRLSVERVWSEVARILAAPDPARALALMADTGVLSAILPEADLARAATILATPADPVLRLAGLLDARATEPVALRWRLSAADRERLVALRVAPAIAPDADDDTLRRALADTPPDILIGRARLAGLDPARIAAIPRPVFPLEGRDALALGVPPGPLVGQLLREVRGWWRDHGCRPDTASCRAELARTASQAVRSPLA